MPHPSLRAISALLSLVLFLAAAIPAEPARAQNTPLAAVPGAVELTLALGASTQIDLALTNTGAAPLIPRLFEAYPAAGPALSAAPAFAQVRLPNQGVRVDPLLRNALAAAPEAPVEALVFLADQADLSAAYGLSDWKARGELVYRTLRTHAENGQRELRALLDARGLAYTSLWIVNGLVVRGDAADLAAIAGRAEVAELRANRTTALESASAQVVSASCSPDASNVCWNIARIGASRVWSGFGVRGEGIVVANVDSGVRFDHPALLGQYRGNRGGAIDHNYHWYDIFGASPFPVDSGDHGTHTMGTMAARGFSAAEPAVGVAPGARWMAVRACGARECSERDLILAAQWLLAPTDLGGNNPRPELRPHVINNSWTSGKDSSWYAGYTAAWRAAGIYPVFSAGNTGNSTGCSTVQSPSDYNDVTAVGALDNADRVTSFSSIGPGSGGRIKPDLTAPGSGIWSTMATSGRPYGSNSGTSMAAPHVAGVAALLMAANPALIGNYDAVYAALTGAAVPQTGDSRFLGPTHSACAPLASPNNIYGCGRLDAYGAVARVTIDVPWLSLPAMPLPALEAGATASVRLVLDARMVPRPGRYEARVLIHGATLTEPPIVVPVTLTVPTDPSHATVSGRLTQAADGAAIQGRVTVVGGATASSDEQGRYTLTLPPGSGPYTLSADARDSIPLQRDIQLAPGQQATLDFALDPDQPRLALGPPPDKLALAFGRQQALTITLSNEGSRTLTYSAALAAEPFGVWRSDEPGGPPSVWTDPPADAVTLALEDDGVSGPIPLGFVFPFAGGRHEQLYVLANGVISFAPLPAAGVPFTRSCLPLTETPGAAIVPLRLDFDPSRSGARISYGYVEGGVLISWEQVPLYNDLASRFSFQALLLPDGRISLRYRELAASPPSEGASYGLQFRSRDVQSLGCQTELGLRAGLTVELRPQPLPALWLSLEPVVGQLEPGASAELTLNARWVAPSSGSWPYSGVVRLQSNDPLLPQSRISIRLTPDAAPYRLLLPMTANLARP